MDSSSKSNNMLYDFDYVEAKSLDQASSFLSKHKGKAKLYAGGTDQVVDIRFKNQIPELIVNINKIKGLNYIKQENNFLKIGTLTNLTQIQQSSLLQSTFPSLIDATVPFASFQIRNRATIGGNICHSTPSADMAPPMLVLNSSAKVVSSEKERNIPLNEFFSGQNQNNLKSDEIVKEFILPIPPKKSGNSYLRHSSRGALDIAVAGVACYLELDDKNNIKDAKISLGAVAPKPIRALKSENILKGKKLTSELILKTSTMAVSEATPISDVRSSLEYRKKITGVLVKRAINLALERCNN